MALRATTVRFGEHLWDLLEQEASREGVSVAQFVRDSAMLRIGYLAGRRGDDDVERVLRELMPGDARPSPAPRRQSDNLVDPGRLSALRETRLLDGRPDAPLERMTNLTARLLRVPVALISLVCDDRQVFAGCVGLHEPWATRRGTPLSHSFCQHVVRSGAALVVPDARGDSRVRDNRAIDDLGVVAYAGVPLVTPEGHVLGTLCAIDHAPRAWSGAEVDLLTELAQPVVSELQLRRLSSAERSAVA